MFEKKEKFSLSIENIDESDSNLDVLNSVQGIEWTDEEEGELALDVFQTAEELIIATTMAGTPPEGIELHLHNDLLTIRGERPSPIPPGAKSFVSECFWGKFSRTLVLPVDVKAELARADYKNGVLLIHLPKVKPDNNIPIFVVEE